MKIFLGDLVHTWEKVSLWTIPLNVGYIGAYADSQIDENMEIRLFKRPELMIEAIKAEKPDVVGLAFYVWNTNLNTHVFDIAKRANPSVLNVGGGPNFTSANARGETARKFFADNRACDAYVVNQGERGFTELMRQFLDCGGDVARLRERQVPGAMINAPHTNDGYLIGDALDIIRDLDEIPSPYLLGMLDPFFDEPFVPILETNRSCPYRCTFCAWGIGTGKLAKFSTERVFAEIEYISERCTQSMNVFIADANFSVLDRDQEIARKLRTCHDKFGYPCHVGIQWNKTRPDRVLNCARELREITEVGASMQSLHPDVLSAIKRKNLPLEDVANLLAQIQEDGIEMTLFSELILGLPNETWDSHIDANKRLVDLGAEVFNYNLHLLPGTEMDSADSRSAYFRRTGWRIHDNAFGIYDGAKVFEGQEVVLQTNSMGLKELRSFRFIHFLIQFMWGRKWYFDYLHLMWRAGVHPIDMIVRIAARFDTDQGAMGALHERFKDDHELENFATFEELAEYWGQDQNLARLRDGEYGKLNYMYTYEILLEYYDEFNDFLSDIAREVVATEEISDSSGFLAQIEDVLAFSRELRIALTQSLDGVVEQKRRSFNYDLLSWRKSGYEGTPARISTSDRFDYEFYLPSQQREILQRQLSQFRSHNMKLTLRKMSEEINADEFFYQVRPVAHETDVVEAR